MKGPTEIIPRQLFGEQSAMTIKLIDQAIIEISAALWRGQPPYTGKIGVVWKTGPTRYKNPSPVRYDFNKSKLPRSHQISWRHISKGGKARSSFAINYYQVRKLLKLLAALYKMRKHITTKMGHFEIFENHLPRKREEIEAIRVDVAELAADIEANLAERLTRAEREEMLRFEVPEGLTLAQDSFAAPDEVADATESNAGDEENTGAREYLKSLVPKGVIPVEDYIDGPDYSKSKT